MKELQIIKCDFSQEEHVRAEIDLMCEYMSDIMGNATLLDNSQNQKLIKGLKSHPNAIVLLAKYNDKFVGLTNGFINFSTFSVSNFLNIHDVIVKSTYRGLGIGRMLMTENIRIAKEEFNCSKITLEVREDNLIAQNLYQSLGFGSTVPPMAYWVVILK